MKKVADQKPLTNEARIKKMEAVVAKAQKELTVIIAKNRKTTNELHERMSNLTKALRELPPKTKKAEPKALKVPPKKT